MALPRKAWNLLKLTQYPGLPITAASYAKAAVRQALPSQLLNVDRCP
jgi:hypothetical protein